MCKVANDRLQIGASMQKVHIWGQMGVKYVKGANNGTKGCKVCKGHK